MYKSRWPPISKKIAMLASTPGDPGTAAGVEGPSEPTPPDTGPGDRDRRRHRHRHHRRRKQPPLRRSFIDKIKQRWQDAKDEWNEWQDDAREGRRDKWGQKTDKYGQYWEEIKKKDALERVKSREEREVRKLNKKKDEGKTPAVEEVPVVTKAPATSGQILNEADREQPLSANEAELVGTTAVDALAVPSDNMADGYEQHDSKPDNVPGDDIHTEPHVDPPGYQSNAPSTSDGDSDDSSSDASSTRATVKSNTSRKPASARGGGGEASGHSTFNMHEDFDDEYDGTGDDDVDDFDNAASYVAPSVSKPSLPESTILEVSADSEPVPSRRSPRPYYVFKPTANETGLRPGTNSRTQNRSPRPYHIPDLACYESHTSCEDLPPTRPRPPQPYARSRMPPVDYHENPGVRQDHHVPLSSASRRSFTHVIADGYRHHQGRQQVTSSKNFHNIRGSNFCYVMIDGQVYETSPNHNFRQSNLGHHNGRMGVPQQHRERMQETEKHNTESDEETDSEYERQQQQEKRESRRRQKKHKKRERERQREQDRELEAEAERERDPRRRKEREHDLRKKSGKHRTQRKDSSLSLSSSGEESGHEPYHLYALLSVSPRASQAEVTKAAKAARIRVHPDRLGADRSDQQKEEDQLKAAEVGHAADILTDPARRRNYDEADEDCEASQASRRRRC